eukprot:gene5232-2574_t
MVLSCAPPSGWLVVYEMQPMSVEMLVGRARRPAPGLHWRAPRRSTMISSWTVRIVIHGSEYLHLETNVATPGAGKIRGEG